MQNSAIDVTLGLILMYLILSLLCTVINEFMPRSSSCEPTRSPQHSNRCSTTGPCARPSTGTG